MSSITAIKKLSVGVIFDGFSLQFELVEAYTSDLWVGVGASWENDVRLGLFTLEKSVSHNISGMNIRVVSEFWAG